MLAAKLAPTTEVGQVVIMDFNLRAAYSETDIGTPHEWQRRKGRAFQAIDYANPDVICVQECGADKTKPGQDQRGDILAHFGEGWGSHFRGKVGIFFNLSKIDLLDSWWWDLQQPPKDLKGNGCSPRRFPLAKLRLKSTGQVFGVGSSQLGVHIPDQTAWQKKQAAGIAAAVQNVGLLGCTIVGIDGNCAARPPADGVFKVLAEAGLEHVRGKLPVNEVIEGNARTFHGWLGAGARPTLRDGQWLDDLASGQEITWESAEVVFSDEGSDHNAIRGTALLHSNVVNAA